MDTLGLDELKSKIRYADGEPLIKEVGNVTVVGERHIYPHVDITETRFWGEVGRSAEEAGRVFLEHPTDPSVNGWSQVAAMATYMRQAENYAGQEKIGYLDKTVGDIARLEGGYAEAGLNEAGNMTVVASLFKSDLLAYNGSELLEKIEERLKAVAPDMEDNEFRLARGRLLILANTEIGKTFIRFDAEVRERIMQEELAMGLAKSGPETKTMVVVGESHVKGIERTLSEPSYRTPINPEQLQTINDFLVRTRNMLEVSS